MKVDDLSGIWGVKLLRYEKENTSDFLIKVAVEKYPRKGLGPRKKKMEFEPKFASGDQNIRRFNLANGYYPCHGSAVLGSREKLLCFGKNRISDPMDCPIISRMTRYSL